MTEPSFTEEDREQLVQMADRLHRYTGGQERSADAIDAALTHIEELEGQLTYADYLVGIARDYLATTEAPDE